MCVFDHPEKALAEMKKHVKPGSGGRLILLENSRSTFWPLGILQDLTEPVVTPLSKVSNDTVARMWMSTETIGYLR